MKLIRLPLNAVFVAFYVVCPLINAEEPSTPKENASRVAKAEVTFDMKKVEEEVAAHYGKAHPEIQEYVLWTARTFGPGGLWIPEDAFSDLTDERREKRVEYLATLFNDAEYGRHLCPRLAEASALKDERLVPLLIKVAAFHRADQDYDCRAKWMAVAALARQQSDEAVPILVSLVDHGNQNTRNWSRAALSRLAGEDFKQDKQAWARWWQEKGHPAIDEKLLQPTEVVSPVKK